MRWRFRRGRDSPLQYRINLLILGFNVTLYFHNNSVDQKSRGIKYQFHTFDAFSKVLFGPLQKTTLLPEKFWIRFWGLYINFYLYSPIEISYAVI